MKGIHIDLTGTPLLALKRREHQSFFDARHQGLPRSRQSRKVALGVLRERKLHPFESDALDSPDLRVPPRTDKANHFVYFRIMTIQRDILQERAHLEAVTGGVPRFHLGEEQGINTGFCTQAQDLKRWQERQRWQ